MRHRRKPRPAELEVPPCFDEPRQFHANYEATGRNGACRDCLREYQQEMLAVGRCDPYDYAVTPIARALLGTPADDDEEEEPFTPRVLQPTM